MNAFGLTGNMGCGKSTVASVLKTFENVLVLDADRIAKGIISEEQYRKQIIEMLEAQVFPNGTLDAKALARILFADAGKKALFEEMIHPLVWAAIEEKVAVADAQTLCIVESALIYETGSEDRFIVVVATACNRAEQLRRLRQRGMTDEQIFARLKTQLPTADKVKKADFVLHTDCTRFELRKRVGKLYRYMRNIQSEKGL